MKIIEPKVELWQQGDDAKAHVARCARVCYQWKECSCLKGIRLEDVTVELEEEAYEEMRNNK